MITISNISKWYGTMQVLKNCSTEVAKGEVVVVCGPSGSGKSTLIKCVNGLEPFEQGTITVDGISVGDPKTNLPKLRARIGMVFQHFELFPHLSVMRNLSLAQIKVLGRDPKAADEKGSRNLLGIKSPVIDELIEGIINVCSDHSAAGSSRASLVAHTRALDRVLQYGYYVIPNYHLPAFRVAYWDKFRRPQVSPKYGIGLDTWWVDPKAEQTIEAKKGEAAK